MKTKLPKPDISLNGTRIRIRTGSEGPRHDPYHYTELTVWRLGHVWRLHTGMGVWLQKDGSHWEGDEEKLIQQFINETGADPGQWAHWYYQARHRCRQCGTRELESHDGFPGETLTTCPKCKIIVYSDINWSAIE